MLGLVVTNEQIKRSRCRRAKELTRFRSDLQRRRFRQPLEAHPGVVMAAESVELARALGSVTCLGTSARTSIGICLDGSLDATATSRWSAGSPVTKTAQTGPFRVTTEGAGSGTIGRTDVAE